MSLTKDQIVANILSTLPKHLGHDKLLSQLDENQGDTAQRQGTLYTLMSLINDPDLNSKIYALGVPHPEVAYALLESPWPAWYRRTSDPSNVSGIDPRQFSRDQLSILKLGMACTGSQWRLLKILLAQLLRLTFHQNYFNGTSYTVPDIMVPSEVGTYARGFMGWLSSPITHIADLTMILDVAFRNVGTLNIWSTDNMLAQNLLVAAHKYPSLSGKLVMWIYKKTDFMSRLWAYHTDEDGNNGCSPLYWLYRMAFLKLEGYDPGSTAP